MKNSKEFKAKNMTGSLPLLETADGDLIFESAAIARYISSGHDTLLGKTKFQAAKIDDWLAYQ